MTMSTGSIDTCTGCPNAELMSIAGCPAWQHPCLNSGVGSCITRDLRCIWQGNAPLRDECRKLTVRFGRSFHEHTMGCLVADILHFRTDKPVQVCQERRVVAPNNCMVQMMVPQQVNGTFLRHSKHRHYNSKFVPSYMLPPKLPNVNKFIK